jgi:ACS family hexuronate transporter-like MFS transporter
MSRDSEAKLSLSRAWLISAVAILAVAVSYVDRQVLAVLAPWVQEALGIKDGAYGGLMGAFFAAYMLGAPHAGKWIDKVGARWGLVASLLLWSGVAALHAVVPGFFMLLVLRVALGLTEAPSFPGAAQTIQRVLPPGARSAGHGLLYAGGSIGIAAATVLSVYLASRFGWRAAFVGTALIGLLWVPLWLIATSSSKAIEVLGRPAASETGRAKISLFKLAGDPLILRAGLAILSCAPICAFALIWPSKYLVKVHGLELGEVTAYLWWAPVCFDVGSLGFGAWTSFLERRRLRAGRTTDGVRRPLFTLAIALGLAIVAVPVAGGPWAAMALVGIAVAGAGGILSLTTSDLMGRVAKQRVGATGGFISASFSLGMILANPLIGQLVQRTEGYTLPLLVLGAWLIPGTIAWLGWSPTSRLATDAA